MMATHKKYVMENNNKNYTNDSESPWCFQELHDYIAFAVLFAFYVMMCCIYTMHVCMTRNCEPRVLIRKLLEDADAQKLNPQKQPLSRATTRRQITPV